MNIKKVFFYIACLFLACQAQPLSSFEETWRTWAKKFGSELLNLSQAVTKVGDIKSKYLLENATVNKVDGKDLLNQIIEYLSRMVNRKIETVQCIRESAEKLAKEFEFDETSVFNFSYPSMKHFNETNDTSIFTITNKKGSNLTYLDVSLSPDEHFYNIPVNLEVSGVQVPTNVYDRYLRVAEAIQWSEGLNRVFEQNYKSDPTLSWQYFGATSGMLRLFPAMKWRQDRDVDLYDCRTQNWFVEAATCSKDVIVLMDNSGSMTGMRNTIAKLVVNSILETFGINDFINVFRFSWTAEPVLPCFKDTLAPATLENVLNFQRAVSEVKPEGNASFPNAFETALNLLEEYREMRGCDEDSECNQAIMLVTDSLPGNITDVFERLNYRNGSIPVRIFTYLLGIEVRGVEEIQAIACTNRGYYVHVHTLDEVRDQVLKYIPVIARPLVLQSEFHPVFWNHVLADVQDPKVSTWLWEVMEKKQQRDRLSAHKAKKSEYFSQEKEDKQYVQMKTQQTEEEEEKVSYQEYRLMTTVSVPAYDFKRNENNETRMAELLGVAGLDVPLEEFYSLTFPYKIGVNGYAFIVTNNGYLLVHPDLRPVDDGYLAKNFQSVDFVEVEFADDDADEREHNPEILRLRDAIVNQTEGEVRNISIKFHLDNMRRVQVEKRDYYFAPLPDTPYTVGLALPTTYGKYQIGVVDIVKKSTKLQGIKLVNFFSGNEWKIHPDWTYCKYYFSSQHIFESNEKQLYHFLSMMSERDWQWKSLYDDDDFDDGGEEEDDDDDDTEDHCERPELDENEYYCDKDLIELVVLDARVTESAFKNPNFLNSNYSVSLLKRYNATLRFVATQSGLTRWQKIPKPTADEDTSSKFTDTFTRTIDEPWYKAAVLWHEVDQNSFVFSVPFDSGHIEDLQVTSTQAIFRRDGGEEAPACVVGFQLTHQSFYDNFMGITNKSNKSCSSDELECYVIDDNGYVLISENKNDTGKFFGEIDGAIMESLVQTGVYREIPIYDYQVVCVEISSGLKANGSASYLLTPWNYIRLAADWFIGEVLLSIVQTFYYQLYNIDMSFALPVDDSSPVDYGSEEIEGEENLGPDEKIPDINLHKKPVREQVTWPCDEKRNLYLLQQINMIENGHYQSEENDARSHFVMKIPHSNLVLLVVDSTLEKFYKNVTTKPTRLLHETCHRINLNHLYRRRLSGCITHHPLEDEISACGDAAHILLSWMLVLTTATVLLASILK